MIDKIHKHTKRIEKRKNVICKLLCFSLILFPFFLRANVDESIYYSKEPTPLWIRYYDFPLEPIPTKPSQINLQYLLIDTQKNIEEKTSYHHYALKVLTQNGAELLTQIQISFDPSYSRILMHNICIYREGKPLHRLENTHHKLIQRETDLERNLYQGSLTLVYFLDDVRKGDIVEYSYSVVGEHPLASSYYTDMVYFQRNSTVEKISHRLIADSSCSFSTKSARADIQPQINDLTPSLREWIWETSETIPYFTDRSQPVWFNYPDWIQISQYSSWNEVVQNILPLFRLPADFDLSIPFEMLDLVQEWQESSTDLSIQALLALRFVQDEIRYFGFENDMRGFQPTDPRKTFQRRFGDCKDKTFLLHTFLKLMNIPSKMLLVNTDQKRVLPDLLPTPFAFNHIVLQIEIGNTMYYVDPTLSLQGGSLENNFFPDYEWGLILSENTFELTPLPAHVIKHPTEIDSQITIETENTANLKIKRMYYGLFADRLRRTLEWRGARMISGVSLSSLHKVHGAASLASPIEVLDDRENNTITLFECFTFPVQNIQGKKTIEFFSYIFKNYLHPPINPQRSSPYKISYPLWVKERIHIQSPFIEWTPSRENLTKEHEAFFYDYSMYSEGNNLFFHFELKHLQDHIPHHILYDHWLLINEINQKKVPRITIASQDSSTKN